MNRPILSMAAYLALALGCTAAPPADLTDADQQAIREFFEEVGRTLSPEDNQAWANTFTEDAVLMFEDAPTIRGREALRAWGEDTTATGSPVALSVTFSDLGIHGGGDWAWVTAIATASFEGVEGQVSLRQLTVLERQADGGWLTAAVHVSANPPPMAN